jgi:hypothetical protein
VKETAVAGKDEERHSDEEGCAPAGDTQGHEAPGDDRRREEQSHHDLGEQTAACLEQTPGEEGRHRRARQHRPRKHRVVLAELDVVPQVDAQVAAGSKRPADALERIDGQGEGDEQGGAPARARKPLEALEHRDDTRTECGRPRRRHRGARSYW